MREHDDYKNHKVSKVETTSFRSKSEKFTKENKILILLNIVDFCLTLTNASIKDILKIQATDQVLDMPYLEDLILLIPLWFSLSSLCCVLACIGV